MEYQSDLLHNSAFALGLALALILASLISRIVYMQKFHPLSKFPGPWYATSFSVFGAIISVRQQEPAFLMSLVKKYGTDRPIRISPTLLLFPRPSALKDIYWDHQCNRKASWYDTPALGTPHLFTTVDANDHRVLRKALSNAPWTIGQLKNTWESRFGDQVNLFIEKMREHAAAKHSVCLSDKVSEFAADIMSMIAFGEPFGSVENQRDEKNILGNWRKGLTFFGVVWRWRFFRETLMNFPVIGPWCLPEFNPNTGMGWLVCEADRQVSAREKANAEKSYNGKPDFMQHALEARFSDGSSLTGTQTRAHVTLLIQAGADTTATALGSILRFLVTDSTALARARAEIAIAEEAKLLSTPVKYEETRRHLPFFCACIREGLRLHPPAVNLFARVVPKGGKVIDGHFVPAGTNVTSHGYVVQRDPATYSSDAEVFRPERWMTDEKRVYELEAAQFTFGVGSRGCLGKDVAYMEMYKLLPEIVRRFDVEVESYGRFAVDGGVAYNVGFMGKLTERY